MHTTFAPVGRIFYGLAIAAMGALTIYYRTFPYMLVPPNHGWLTDHLTPMYVSGGLLFLAGVCILLAIKSRFVSLVLASLLLSIFIFWFLPYELLVSPNYGHFGVWENAAKELALAGGACVVAGDRRLLPVGTVVFGLTILSFGIDHFLYARQAAGYIPSWIPIHLFWMYFTGSALFGSSLCIILNIRRNGMAALLGGMILIWVFILHLPKALASPAGDPGGEITSAFLALAYCGIAFVIAGTRPGRAPSQVFVLE
ncbi:MAG TPA: hypothetical protein VHE54_12250 [Puia sp.]|nr:hypothetical protein [Puia sp.]